MVVLLTVGIFVFEMKILFFLSSTGCKALLEISPTKYYNIFKCAISLVMLGVILTISGITVIEDLLHLVWNDNIGIFNSVYIRSTFYSISKLSFDFQRWWLIHDMDSSSVWITQERERSVSSILLRFRDKNRNFPRPAKTSRCLCLQLPFRKEEDLFGKIHHFMNMGRLGSPQPT